MGAWFQWENWSVFCEEPIPTVTFLMSTNYYGVIIILPHFVDETKTKVYMSATSRWPVCHQDSRQQLRYGRVSLRRPCLLYALCQAQPQHRRSELSQTMAYIAKLDHSWHHEKHRSSFAQFLICLKEMDKFYYSADDIQWKSQCINRLFTLFDPTHLLFCPI